MRQLVHQPGRSRSRIRRRGDRAKPPGGEERKNELIRFETVAALGLRTHWQIHFASGPGPGQTEVREVMDVPLGMLGRAALALIGKFPEGEVPANLHRLKEVMEEGRVTDKSYSVPGKF